MLETTCLNIIQHSPATGFAAIHPLLNSIPEETLARIPLPAFRLVGWFPSGREDTGTSLTDSQSENEQLRFFTASRAERYLRLFALAVPASARPRRIVYTYAAQPHAGVQKFLSLLGETLSLQAWPGAPEPELATEKIHALAVRRLGAGDSWAAAYLAEHFPKAFAPSERERVLGISLALLGHTDAAEPHLARWAELSEPINRAWALYSLAMLYARHHRRGSLSLERADQLLEEAYAILNQAAAPSGTDPFELEFARIFNRNGKALIEFRRHRIWNAILLLDSGVAKIPPGLPKYELHKSVLVYNRAQCWAALGELNNAIRDYSILCEMDPYYPENRLEFAKVLLQSGDLTEAHRQAQRAVELDPALVEGPAVLARVLLTLGENLRALTAIDQAIALTPETPEFRVDRAEALCGLGEYLKAADELTVLDTRELAGDHLEQYFILLSECRLNLSGKEAAAEVLRQGLLRVPRSEALRENLEIVGAYA